MPLFILGEDEAEQRIDSLLEAYSVDGVEVLDDDDEGPNTNRNRRSDDDDDSWNVIRSN